MAAWIGAGGVILLAVILWDAFETIILPRRVTRRIRLARMFYKYTWLPWRLVASRMKPGKWREGFLGVYGPLSVLTLFAVWAVGLIFAFGMMQWSVSALQSGAESYWTELYFSGTTFFTLGLGDIAPHTSPARVITVLETGTGFGFLAVVISYLPVLYGAFSKREVNISLLDARAGSPPTAAELLRRHARQKNLAALDDYLRAWEIWAAELMESHLSYPVLCYFRSQHNNQSWVAALAAILDTCAVLIANTEGSEAVEGELRWQAELTFAICRHALVDLAQAMNIPPHAVPAERLDAATSAELREMLGARGAELCKAREGDASLKRMREMYEPFLFGFSDRLLMPLPGWSPARTSADNWRTSAWGKVASPAKTTGSAELEDEEHS
ncbi:MAG TPA: potassium channel family protein [Terriglobia bacterium]|nr:potassium channel family protein [Terriglobia bacterium]